MSQQAESNSIDLTQYREQTDSLVESINETTALCNDIADTMAELSRSSAAFGESTDRLGSGTNQARDLHKRQQVAADGGRNTDRATDD